MKRWKVPQPGPAVPPDAKCAASESATIAVDASDAVEPCTLVEPFARPQGKARAASSRAFGYLLAGSLIPILADLRYSLTGASRRPVPQELLHSACAVHFTRIEVPFSVDRDSMWPVEVAGLTSACSESGD